MKRVRGLLAGLAVCVLTAPPGAAAEADHITVDATGAGRPFPHFWEHMFGSGRAVLSLRESYRQDLAAARSITDLQYVRFHAILHDEVGVYGEDKHGAPVYDFSYVDQIYDGLLAQGVRPFVEISFMPRQLAGRDVRHTFWYHPYISPPKDYRRWDDLIEAFARHLVERYGIDEVRRWYFEVWNEPNLDFWAGVPKQATYWTLYEHTARALKRVDPALRVGGPATAQAAWVPDFIRFTSEHKVPVDFVSTHVYGDDTPKVFGSNQPVPRREFVCRAVDKVHREILASTRPDLPLLWSEFNASYANFPKVTDAPFMGPWLAETVSQCDGLVQEMSYWTFSDVFEEQGVVKTPFYGGFGLRAVGGVPKPAFNAFALLHRLGSERLSPEVPSALLTRRSDGTLVVAAWNYREVGAAGAVARTVELTFAHTPARSAEVQVVDAEHGNFAGAYAHMGSPAYPTQAQLEELRRAAALPPAITRTLDAQQRLTIEIPPDGLVLVTVNGGADH
ncbi:MAG: glycosyl hydrolase family 39 [Proteobacteria bacterium]|nr:glycosyl hydrolase family 39 [Pseudomonadota bacterium]